MFSGASRTLLRHLSMKLILGISSTLKASKLSLDFGLTLPHLPIHQVPMHFEYRMPWSFRRLVVTFYLH